MHGTLDRPSEPEPVEISPVNANQSTILLPTPAILEQAGARLRGGRLVAFATETVYGLGANALDPAAVAGVFELKGRPLYDPLIVHVASLEMARSLTTNWSALAEKLAHRFWPGPLTLVLPRAEIVPDLVTAGLPNVALRWPAHPLAQSLIQAAQRPIAAPSANRFASISPTSAADVAAELSDPELWILDGGPCLHGLESTVVSLVGTHPVVLRLGSLAVEELEQVLGPLTIAARSVKESDLHQGLASPGNLSRHYAPRTPLTCLTLEELKQLPPEVTQSSGLLCFGSQVDPDQTARFAHVENLSPEADLRQAAARVYAALRHLDQAGLPRLIALRLPDVGLGRAINDRLQRASAL